MTRHAFLVLFAVLAFLGCGDGSAAQAGRSSASALAEPAPSASASSPSPVASALPPPAPSASAPAPATAKVTPLLWEVKKGGAENWLLGTMHLGIDAEKDLHPVAFQKLDASSTVVLELDVDIDPMESMGVVLLPEGQTVHDRLSPGRWKLLVDKVGSFLTPESSLKKMKAWVLVTLLVQTMLPETDPMDVVIHKRAKAAKKELVYLETLREQAAMVEQAMNVNYLDDLLGDLPAAEKMMLDLAGAFRSGDAAALEKVVFDPDEMKKHPEMIDLLLVDRNRKWVPKLAPRFEKGRVFVAVGAAHLVGDQGLVKLLEKKGWQLARVPAP